MARQGLMDDSGYDFFDVSDCANYESCREDAFNDGYEKGRADAIAEFKDLGKLYSEIRADAIDECKEVEIVNSIVNSSFMNSDMKVLALQRWLQEWGGANKNVKEQDK